MRACAYLQIDGLERMSKDRDSLHSTLLTRATRAEQDAAALQDRLDDVESRANQVASDRDASRAQLVEALAEIDNLQQRVARLAEQLQHAEQQLETVTDDRELALVGAVPLLAVPCCRCTSRLMRRPARALLHAVVATQRRA